MSKDSYWFRHDSSAGRTLRMRKMSHIYGHEGKGMYWDVVEVLRDQDGYQFNSDDSSLNLLADLIGCKDEIRFCNWFKDCLKLGLFEDDGTNFICPALTENMEMWETKKANGSKGGRPKKTESKPKAKPKPKANQKHNRTEQNIIEQNIIESKKFTFPTISEFLEYAKDKAKEYKMTVNDQTIKLKYEAWKEAGWKDGNGNVIKSWKSKVCHNLQHWQTSKGNQTEPTASKYDFL